MNTVLEKLIERKLAEQRQIEEQQDQVAQAARALNGLHLQIEEELDVLRRALTALASNVAADATVVPREAVEDEQAPIHAIPTTSRAPRVRQGAPQRSRGTSKYDLDAVAKAACEAYAAGKSMRAAVAEALGITVSIAGPLIVQARKTHDIPAGPVGRPKVHPSAVAATPIEAEPEPVVPPRAQASSAPVTGRALRCEEPGCSAAFRPDQTSRLFTHARVEHGRRPTTSERTPRDEEDVAA